MTEQISLYENQLTGTIPSEMEFMTDLSTFADTLILGTLSDHFLLGNLFLGTNLLSGSFPVMFKTMSGLRESLLRISGAQCILTNLVIFEQSGLICQTIVSQG